MTLNDTLSPASRPALKRGDCILPISLTTWQLNRIFNGRIASSFWPLHQFVGNPLSHSCRWSQHTTRTFELGIYTDSITWFYWYSNWQSSRYVDPEPSSPPLVGGLLDQLFSTYWLIPSHTSQCDKSTSYYGQTIFEQTGDNWLHDASPQASLSIDAVTSTLWTRSSSRSPVFTDLMVVALLELATTRIHKRNYCPRIQS